MWTLEELNKERRNRELEPMNRLQLVVNQDALESYARSPGKQGNIDHLKMVLSANGVRKEEMAYLISPEGLINIQQVDHDSL